MGERDFGQRSHDGGPLAHAPARDQAVQHVWIGLRERLDDIGRVGAKEQDRAVGRVGERAAEHELAARGCRARVRDVRRAQRHAALDVIGHDVVEEEVVRSYLP